MKKIDTKHSYYRHFRQMKKIKEKRDREIEGLHAQ